MSSASATPSPRRELRPTTPSPAYISPACSSGPTSPPMSERPLVGILVGSESDRERMEGATKTLDEAGVAYEFEVRSAHRTPDSVAEYAKTARERGLKVLICGAGLAAALPG